MSNSAAIQEKICQQCKKNFKLVNKFCSQRCANTFVSNQNKLEKNLKIRNSLLKHHGIEKNYHVINIDRCKFVLEYFLENVKRRYIPDFEITLIDGSKLIVECKTILSCKELQRKWEIYYKSINPKMKALEKYCEQNKYKLLFFNKDMHSKFYNNLKKEDLLLSLNDLL